MDKLTEFKGEAVEFVESLLVRDGVVCDVYLFTNDKEKDLGVITIEAGKMSPRQKVLQGDQTIFGFTDGQGELEVVDVNGNGKKYKYPSQDSPIEINVETGEIVQWFAGQKSELICYEIYYHPTRRVGMKTFNEWSRSLLDHSLSFC